MRVAEFKIGNTKIIINDECLIYRTKEEREQVFRRVSDIAYEGLLRQMAAKEREEAADRKNVT